MSLIYVAAPYSHPNRFVVQKRINLFARHMARLIEEGHYPVSPLMNHLLQRETPINFPLTWEYWEGYSKELLSRCNSLEVLCLDGWGKSTGVIAEIALAKELGIPVNYVDKAEDSSYSANH